MPILDPELRRIQARSAAHALHAKYDSHDLTAPARAAFLTRFERQVDPEGVLPRAERQRRAQHALKAHMIALSYRALKRRRQRRGEAVDAGASDCATENGEETEA